MSANDHFAELALSVKSNGGFLVFQEVQNWYCTHYIDVDDVSVHKHIKDLISIISYYLDQHQIISMADLCKAIVEPSYYKRSFKDLSDRQNDHINYRILAELVGSMVLCKVSKIPGLRELADARDAAHAKVFEGL